MSTTRKTTTKKTTAKKPTTKSKAAPVKDVKSEIDTSEEVNSEAEAKYAKEQADEAAKVASEKAKEDLDTDVNVADGEGKEVETPSVEAEEDATGGENPLGTIDGVSEYLSAPGDTIDSKLVIIMRDGPTAIRSVVGPLLGYKEEGDISTPAMGEEYTLGMLYNVYTLIKSVVETEDDAEFKVKMDLLNLIVMNNKAAGQAFNELRMLRYDYLWHWGETSLHTYQVLVSVICGLANRSTREEMLKRIDLNSNLMTTGTELSQDHIERFVRYYMQ